MKELTPASGGMSRYPGPAPGRYRRSVSAPAETSRPGRAEVDHHHVRLQQPVTFQQLFELVGGTRAHAFGLGLLHEGSEKCSLSQRWLLCCG